MKPNRREVIAALSSATLGCVSTSPSLTASDELQNFCTLGFSTYGLPESTLEESIELVRRNRYDSIEFCVTADRESAAEKLPFKRRRQIRQNLSQRGLRLTSLMANLRPLESKQRHENDLERLKRDCELAHDLSPRNPPIIQTVLGGKIWDSVKDLCVQRIADWVDIADRYEAVIAVKPHRGHAMSRPSEARWLASQLNDPPRLKMWFDYSHFVFRDMPIDTVVSESRPMIGGVAVKDASQVDGKVRFALPGEAGTIDYAKLVRRLYSAGFRGDVCVEVSSQVWKKEEYDPAVAARESYRVLSDAMRRAGIPRPA